MSKQRHRNVSNFPKFQQPGIGWASIWIQADSSKTILNLYTKLPPEDKGHASQKLPDLNFQLNLWHATHVMIHATHIALKTNTTFCTMTTTHGHWLVFQHNSHLLCREVKLIKPAVTQTILSMLHIFFQVFISSSSSTVYSSSCQSASL